MRMICGTKRKRGGFTLIELIVYFTIFGVASSLGAAVFNYAVQGKAAVRQMNEVHGASQRVMQQIVDRVRVAQTIDDASTTLRLQMASSTINPTIFGLSGGAVYIQEGVDPAVDITPDTIVVSNLSFAKYTNADPSTSTVRIILTSGYKSDGVLKEGTEYTLQTTAMPLR